MTPRSRTAAATALMVLALTLTGCTSDNPSPTPQPTTSAPAPTQAATTPPPTEQELAEAAKQAIIEEGKTSFQAIMDKTTAIQQSGMLGWQELMTYYSTEELLNRKSNFYTQLHDQGVKQTGSSVIVSMTVTSFTEDTTGANHERMTMDVCIDTSAGDFVNPAGESVTMPGYPPRLITVYELQRQSVGYWTLNSETTDEARPC